MKKGKRLDSSDFSFDNRPRTFEQIFHGYPSFDPDHGEEKHPSKLVSITLEHIKDICLFSDRHPPDFPASLASRNVYFNIVFESQDQFQRFISYYGLEKYGVYYIMAEDFAKRIGIDMASGVINNQDERHKNGKVVTNFTSSYFNFSHPHKAPHKEISEKLKSIREDEKKVANYLDWIGTSGGAITICFKNEKDKANTLKALGLEAEYGGKYVWCHDVARALGIELLPCEFKEKEYTGREKKLEEMVITDDDYERLGIDRDKYKWHLQRQKAQK